MEKRRIFLIRCSGLINYNFYITISLCVLIFKVITVLPALLEKFEVRDFVCKIAAFPRDVHGAGKPSTGLALGTTFSRLSTNQPFLLSSSLVSSLE
jgi:hypothetical protein